MPLYFCQMHTDSLPREALPELLASLPPLRREKALNYRFEKDRLLSIAAGLLVRHALARWDISDSALCYGEDGRPCVAGHPELYLSLSHSGVWALCGAGDAPVSVDIQEEEGDREVVSARCYNERERAWMDEARDAGERRRRFYEIFSKKECAIKLGSYSHMREIDTFSPPPGLAYRSLPLPGYSRVICAPPELLPEYVTVL